MLSGQVSSEHEGASPPINPLQAVPAVVRCVGALLLIHSEAQALVKRARPVIHPQDVHEQGLRPCMQQSALVALFSTQASAHSVHVAVAGGHATARVQQELCADALHWFARSTALWIS